MSRSRDIATRLQRLCAQAESLKLAGERLARAMEAATIAAIGVASYMRRPAP